MAYRDVLRSWKNTLQDRLLTFTLKPKQTRRGLVTGKCLVMLLFVVVICSGIINVYLLTNFGKKRILSDKELNSEELPLLKNQDLPQKVKFVALDENEELRRIRRLAREIPGRLDDAGKRDIEKVYKPQHIQPIVSSNAVDWKTYDGKRRNKQPEDKIARHDVIGEKKKTVEETGKKWRLSVGEDDAWDKKIRKTKRKAVPGDLYKLAPRIFDSVPMKFDEGLQNPCWKNDSKDFPLRCLPYFFILGMPKCGTSDLWKKLIQHPQIVPVLKEPHWWTRRRLRLQHGAFADYMRWAQPFLDEVQQGHQNIVYGDASASTLWDNNYWRNFFPSNTSEPPYVLADIIRELLPDAKLIVMLRDPVSRLYSDYLYLSNRSIVSATDFHQKVLKSIKSFEDCQRIKPFRACIYEQQSLDEYVRLLVGLYSPFIREWVRLYPIDQFAFIELTEWNMNCKDILPILFAFLQLDSLAAEKIKEICSIPHVNNNISFRNKIGDMLPETRQVLWKFYQPFNEDLFKILGAESFSW